MKKFVKGCLAVIAVMAVAGVIFCIAGFVLGGSLSIFTHDWGYIEYRQEDGSFYKGEQKIEADFEESFRGVQNLEIEAENAKVEILTGESDECVVKAIGSQKGFKCYMEGDTLVIQREQEGVDWIFSKDKNSSIVLEIPEKIKFENTELKVGVGELNFENAFTRDLSIDCGIGSVIYGGQLEGDVEIQCAIGEVRIALEEESENFNYDISCGIGEVSIGENIYDGIVRQSVNERGRLQKIDVKCGIGNVKVSFQEKERKITKESETEATLTEENYVMEQKKR